jgi:hypothetical protein
MNIVPCKNHFFVSQRVAVTSEQKTWHVHSSKSCPLVFDAPLQNRVKNAVMNKCKAVQKGLNFRNGATEWGYRFLTVAPFFDTVAPFSKQSPRFSGQNLQATTSCWPFLPSKLTPTLFRCHFSLSNTPPTSMVLLLRPICCLERNSNFPTISQSCLADSTIQGAAAPDFDPRLNLKRSLPCRLTKRTWPKTKKREMASFGTKNDNLSVTPPTRTIA